MLGCGYSGVVDVVLGDAVAAGSNLAPGAFVGFLCVCPVSLPCCFFHMHRRRYWFWPRVLALARWAGLGPLVSGRHGGIGILAALLRSCGCSMRTQ